MRSPALPVRAHDSVGQGGMGTEVAGTRFPTLSVLDAIWVSLVPGAGPTVRYSDASRIDVIAASTDPVALDYWAAKHILTEGARERGLTRVGPLDSDGGGVFSIWFRLSMNELSAAGYAVTIDETRMNVYVRELAGP